MKNERSLPFEILKNIGIYLGMVFLAAFLAPILHTFLDFKFKRILSRCLMIGTFGFLFYLVKYYGWSLRSFFDQIQFDLSSQSKQSFWKGFLLGGVFMLFTFIALKFFDVRIWQQDITVLKIMYWLALSFVAGLLIGVIEEVFFRGIVFRLCLKQSALFAYLFSSFIYAILHFFHQADIFVDQTPTIIDSFRLIGGYFQVLLDPIAILPDFIGLYIFGVILAFCFHRTGSVALPIGLHAGVVFIIKVGDSLTRYQEKAPILFWGDEMMYTGVLGWIFLSCLGFFLYFIYRKS